MAVSMRRKKMANTGWKLLVLAVLLVFLGWAVEEYRTWLLIAGVVSLVGAVLASATIAGTRDEGLY